MRERVIKYNNFFTRITVFVKLSFLKIKTSKTVTFTLLSASATAAQSPWPVVYSDHCAERFSLLSFPSPKP